MTIKFQHKILTSAAPAMEVKATDQGMITGYGSIFGNRDRQGDVVLQGAPMLKSNQSDAGPRCLKISAGCALRDN